MAKTALIIGVSSQDGSFLAEFLLNKGYNVIGTIRRSTATYKENIRHLYGQIGLEVADLADGESLARVVRGSTPDEIYNLASQSVSADSWSHPLLTGDVTGLGIVRVVEAARRYAPEARIYQATSREIYGNIQQDFANESTPVDANNPYGIAKSYAHMMVRCFRESYDLFACSGIMFNHESERRGLHFVTRKISAGAACIKNGVKNGLIDELGRPLIGDDGRLHLGRLSSQRDWGYAKEYVEAMWLMLQQHEPIDFVIGTGVAHTVEDVCQIAFDHIGLDWREYVVEDRALHRPTEIKALKGDASKAREVLGWAPRTSFEDLVRLMVDADLTRFRPD
jgi:GDPmannose 4,6-dehydratase